LDFRFPVSKVCISAAVIMNVGFAFQMYRICTVAIETGFRRQIIINEFFRASLTS